MPNLISVTSHGTPQDLANARDFVTAGSLSKLAPEPVRRFAGDALKAFKNVKAVSSANPLTMLANDLLFPDPVADGTLKGAIERHGYIGAGVDP